MAGVEGYFRDGGLFIEDVEADVFIPRPFRGVDSVFFIDVGGDTVDAVFSGQGEFMPAGEDMKFSVVAMEEVDGGGFPFEFSSEGLGEAAGVRIAFGLSEVFRMEDGSRGDGSEAGFPDLDVVAADEGAIRGSVFLAVLSGGKDCAVRGDEGIGVRFRLGGIRRGFRGWRFRLFLLLFLLGGNVVKFRPDVFQRFRLGGARTGEGGFMFRDGAFHSGDDVRFLPDVPRVDGVHGPGHGVDEVLHFRGELAG